MYLQKRICLLLFMSAALTLPVALNHPSHENPDKVRADGGAPPPPPIIWKGRAQAGPQLTADGGAPPPPPIIWPRMRSGGSSLRANA